MSCEKKFSLRKFKQLDNFLACCLFVFLLSGKDVCKVKEKVNLTMSPVKLYLRYSLISSLLETLKFTDSALGVDPIDQIVLFQGKI